MSSRSLEGQNQLVIRQAVLAAGDFAEPVFDNAGAGLSQWLTARGVSAGAIRRLSANPARVEATAELASVGQLLRRIALE